MNEPDTMDIKPILKKLKDKLFGQGKPLANRTAPIELPAQPKPTVVIAKAPPAPVVLAPANPTWGLKVSPPTPVLTPPDSRSSLTKTPKGAEPEKPVRSRDRAPYIIQIGFDFGTAFSKCVVRDVNTDEAWIHIPTESRLELPFLMSSSLRFKRGKLSHLENDDQYVEDGLYHVKMALERVAENQLDDPELDCFKNSRGYGGRKALPEFVRGCAIYLLAGCLGSVRRQCLEKYKDFGKHRQDEIRVNMAVPVASGEQTNIHDEFQEALCLAWVLSDKLEGHPETTWKDLRDIIAAERKASNTKKVKEACYLCSASR